MATTRNPGPDPAAQVLVIGSANADLVVGVERRPGAGETVLGGDLVVQPGGKGANQAVAAARLGSRVAFAGCVGSDGHGDLLLASLTGAGVDVTGVRRLDGVPTGVALISVTPDGDNAIIVSPGANGHVGPADVRRVLADVGASGGGDPGAPVVVLQLELPLDTVVDAVRVAAAQGSRVVLNLAPPAVLPPDVLRRCDPLVLNEHEAAVLLATTGDGPDNGGYPGGGGPGGAGPGGREPSPVATARALLRLGPRGVVLTLGAAGAVVATVDGTAEVPAPRVVPVDTTGAGDALTGSLAGRLAAGDPLVDAVRFAVRVASTSTLRPGAQPSFPGPDDVLPG